MKFKKKLMKLKLEDKFTIIDKLASKLLIFSLSTFLIFNVPNYLFKNNLYQSNLFNVNAQELSNKFKIGTFNDNRVEIYSNSESPNLQTDDIYDETIYFSNKKDLGTLITKSINLINITSHNIKNKYVRISVKNYDSSEHFFTMIWDRDINNKYSVYVNQ